MDRGVRHVSPHVLIRERSTAKRLNTWATRLHQSLVFDVVEHCTMNPVQPYL